MPVGGGEEMTKWSNVLRTIRVLPLAVVLCSPLAAEERTATLRFELSFPSTVRTEPADGRVFVILTRKAEPEPRLQFGKSGGQYKSTPVLRRGCRRAEARPAGRHRRPVHGLSRRAPR